MNEELRAEIEEMIAEAIAGLRGELEEIAKSAAREIAEEVAEDEAQSAAEDAVENAFDDRIEDAVADAVEAYLESHERRLPDGTVVEPRKETMILSPDKTNLIKCRGSVKVFRWGHRGEGQLMIYTGASNTDNIYFATYDEAVAAFNKVKEGIEAGVSVVEL